MGQEILRFPLFPLGLVLLPGETVPLHIFEERYKLMIGECLDEEREFGIIWLADDGLRDVGCGARITQVLERFDDGRMNVLVEGTTPFRLERRIGDLDYPAGDVELLEDTPDSDDAALELRSEPTRLEQLGALFAEALKRIKTAERVAEQASGNGHLKPGGDT